MSSLQIALLHIIPVVAIGLISKNISALNWATGIMCVIAVGIGNPSFVISDLLAIAFAYVCCAPVINNAKARNANEATQQSESDKSTPAKKDRAEQQYATSNTQQGTAKKPCIAHLFQPCVVDNRVEKRAKLHMEGGNRGQAATTAITRVAYRARTGVDVEDAVKIQPSDKGIVNTSPSDVVKTPLCVIDTNDQISQKEHKGKVQEQKENALPEEKPILRDIEKDSWERQKVEDHSEQNRKQQEQRSKQKIITIQKGFSQYGVSCLWHITHEENIPNILKHGVLNHYDAHRLNLNHADISNPGAQRWRERREKNYGRKIHEYAPLYINQKNPMLYVRKELQSHLCLIQVSLSALSDNEYLISDGNAASLDTIFYSSADQLGCLPWDVLRAKCWHDLNDGKRKRCSEVLVYPGIAPTHIAAIHCKSTTIVNKLAKNDIKAVMSPNLFF